MSAFNAICRGANCQVHRAPMNRRPRPYVIGEGDSTIWQAATAAADHARAAASAPGTDFAKQAAALSQTAANTAAAAMQGAVEAPHPWEEQAVKTAQAAASGAAKAAQSTAPAVVQAAQAAASAATAAANKIAPAVEKGTMAAITSKLDSWGPLALIGGGVAIVLGIAVASSGGSSPRR